MALSFETYAVSENNTFRAFWYRGRTPSPPDEGLGPSLGTHRALGLGGNDSEPVSPFVKRQ